MVDDGLVLLLIIFENVQKIILQYTARSLNLVKLTAAVRIGFIRLTRIPVSNLHRKAFV